MNTTENLNTLVDRLGLLKAQIAELSKQEDAIKAQLIESGLEEVEGAIFRTTVSLVEPSAKVDWKAVAAKLKPSHQLVSAHTSPVKSYHTVRVVARTQA